MNPLYNKELGEKETYTLITIQGRCPIDLVKYIFINNLVPDAKFPWDETDYVLLRNWDFLARLYLQAYYRA